MESKMEHNIVYVDSEKKVKELYENLKKESILAIDIEAENNYHHYGYYVSLIQIFGNNTAYIVDALKLKPDDLTPVFELLVNPEIEKVFHDVSFDFRILNYQYKVLPKNVFDTKIAAELLNEKKVGLKSLLDKYFNVVKKKKFQKADWSKRPLTKEQIEYAAGDVIYLIELRNILKKQLIDKKLWATAEKKFKQLEEKEYNLKLQTYLDVKGAKHLTEKEMLLFKDLFSLRDSLARRVNRPPFYIISNKKLIELAKSPVLKLSEWESMRGVHPIVRINAKRFYFSVKKHKNK